MSSRFLCIFSFAYAKLTYESEVWFVGSCLADAKTRKVLPDVALIASNDVCAVVLTCCQQQ